MAMHDGAQIIYTAGKVHNHQPDFKRRQFLLLVQRCRDRAIKETTPIKEIYLEEAARSVLS